MRCVGASLALMVILACSREALREPGSGQRPIIGGSPSTESDFPSAGVLLSIYDFGDGQVFGSMVCTGTLVAPDVVLTAAHCALDPFGGQVARSDYFSFALDVSAFGLSGTEIPPHSYEVALFVSHPDFSLGGGPPPPGLGRFDDVALVFLAGSASDRVPAIVADALDSEAVAVGAEVDIAGYGQRAQNGAEAGVKFHARTRINEINPWEMQIGDRPPTPQKCHGDSGGPTYLDVIDGRTPARRVVGLTSRAYDESDCNRGGIDVRVDAYRDWIESAMIEGCEGGQRVSEVCAIDPGLATAGAGGPSPDAGEGSRGRPDLGPLDTGVLDAGTPSDGGEDDGAVPDVAAGDAPGTLAEREDEGCGCESARAGGGAAPVFLLLALAIQLGFRFAPMRSSASRARSSVSGSGSKSKTERMCW